MMKKKVKVLMEIEGDEENLKNIIKDFEHEIDCWNNAYGKTYNTYAEIVLFYDAHPSNRLTWNG